MGCWFLDFLCSPQCLRREMTKSQHPLPLCWEPALGAHRAGSCMVKRLLIKNIQSDSMARLKLCSWFYSRAEEWLAGCISPEMLCLASLQGSQFSSCLFMEQTERISSSHSAVVQDCVRFYWCSPPGEMSLIKHSEQYWQSCLYWEQPVNPVQLAQSWGAQQGAGEVGSPFVDWSHFPS